MEVVKEPCNFEHEKYDAGSVYKSVDNKRYCASGYYLFGVQCSLCYGEFVQSEKEVKNKRNKPIVP